MNGWGVLSVLSHAVRQRYDRSWTLAPQMPLPVQVSGLKKLGCHAGTEVSVAPEVNLRNPLCKGDEAHK